MSMNTPYGSLISTKNLKEFQELNELGSEQYMVAIADDTTGTGGKIKATKLSSSMISSDADNQLIIGSDNKLYAKMSSITDVIDAQNMYETGRVLRDERGFNQLKEMKRSTFDRSKFTVIGSPIITDDGVASGFSSSSYITKDITISNNYSTFEIDTKIKFNDLNTVYFIGAERNYFIFGQQNNRLILYLSSNGTSWDISSGSYGNRNLVINQDYYIKMLFNGAKYIIKLSTDGLNYTDDIVINSTTKMLFPNHLRIGATWNKSFTGSIDLKQFSITVDGIEVFNGNKTGIDQITETLEIPYTQSKTGSKIVDSVYRNRVQDMYEQFGYADYYTLGNDDCTLPMGEIYGMIKKDTQAIDDKLNDKLNNKLNNKLDLDASNLNTQGKDYVSGLSMPSDRYINLTLGASGTTYTAPANGWFYINKQAQSSGKYWYFNVKNKYSVGYSNVQQYKQVRVIAPVQKNDVIDIDYDLNGETYQFKFIYAEGEQV